MPNKPLSDKEYNEFLEKHVHKTSDLAKRIKQIEKAMDLEDYHREEEAARRAKHAKFVNYALLKASRQTVCQGKTGPDFEKNPGIPKAKKEEWRKKK